MQGTAIPGCNEHQG